MILKTKKSGEEKRYFDFIPGLAVAPENSCAENPVTTLTVSDGFSLFHSRNHLARGVELEKLRRLFFSGAGAVFLKAL